MSTAETRALEELIAEAESEWLMLFTAGPTEPEGSGLRGGTAAPDLVLPDHTGASRSLSEFWADQPALLARDLRQLGHMYFRLFQDYPRAAC